MDRDAISWTRKVVGKTGLEGGRYVKVKGKDKIKSSVMGCPDGNIILVKNTCEESEWRCQVGHRI